LALLLLSTLAETASTPATLRKPLHPLQHLRLFKLNFEINRAFGCTKIDVFLERLEPKHFNGNAPIAGCDCIEAVMPVFVGHGRERLGILDKGDGGARNGLAG